MIVTLNLGQTWIPQGEPGHSLSSLSLVMFDEKTGLMQHAGDWEMLGILPEGVAFDAADRYVVAGTNIEGPEPRASALEFWRVQRMKEHPRGLFPRATPFQLGQCALSGCREQLIRRGDRAVYPGAVVVRFQGFGLRLSVAHEGAAAWNS